MTVPSHAPDKAPCGCPRSPLTPVPALDAHRATDAAQGGSAPLSSSAPVGLSATADRGVFEIHPVGRIGESACWSWRLRDQHGDVVAVGHQYPDGEHCRTAIGIMLAALGVGGETARIVEVAS